MTTLVDEALLRTVAARAAAYLQQVQTRGVVPSPSALEGLRELNEALPDDPATWRNWYSGNGAKRIEKFRQGNPWAMLGNS